MNDHSARRRGKMPMARRQKWRPYRNSGEARPQMEASAQDWFCDSRAQLVKSLDSQRRWNRLTLVFGLLFGACAIVLIALGTWGVIQGSDTHDWIKDVSLRGPAIVA